jgi:hypothetical protein
MSKDSVPKIPGMMFHCVGGQWDKGMFIEGKIHGFMFEARVWDKPHVDGWQGGKITTLKILREKNHYFSEYMISWHPENCLFCYDEDGLLHDDPLGHELKAVLDKLQETCYTLNIPETEEPTCNPLESSSSS